MAKALYHLRCCVAHRSAIRESTLVLTFSAQILGKPKVDQLYVAICVYHHVFWFQISIHYLSRVNRFQRHEDLRAVEGDPRPWVLTAKLLLDLVQILTFQKLHCKANMVLIDKSLVQFHDKAKVFSLEHF